MIDTTTQAAEITRVEHKSLLERIKENKYVRSLTWISVTSITVFVVIVLGSLIVPSLLPHAPHTIDLKARLQPPSVYHWLGTDNLGRDMFARLLVGARISLFVSIGGSLAAAVIGLLLGTLSGYYGGFFDQIWLRVSEIFMSFPAHVLLLVMVAIMGPSMQNIIIIFAITKWSPLYRLVRAQFFSLREEEFVEALRALDIRAVSIIFRHMLTNTLGPITVWFTLAVATGIIQEAGLSFIGLGIQPPTPSLGNLLTAAQDLRVLRRFPWLWMAPGFTIALVTLCVNFIGDWLRDVTDPRLVK
jgi:peptide/nickel transport system permease protein